MRTLQALGRSSSDNYSKFVEDELKRYCSYLGYDTVEAVHASELREQLNWEYYPDRQVLTRSGVTQLVIYKPEIVIDEAKTMCDTSRVSYNIKFRRDYESF